MIHSWVENVNISKEIEIKSPEKMKEELNPWEGIEKHIITSRETISSIIHWLDDRLMVIVWPCSIHDPENALLYAKKLLKLQEKYEDLYIVMRVYFEKPRTTTWWKWLISDPDLDWSFKIEKWIEMARKFLIEVNELWLPTATEFLSPIISQYIADLISWWAIWARTTESQTHREMASWLSCPIWFKNWTDWWTDIAIDAIKASITSHPFLWINDEWKTSILCATWNKDWHLIARWWKGITNYDTDSVNKMVTNLEAAWVNPNIMIDLSHANSEKKHEKQIKVAKKVWKQIWNGKKNIIWVMIESNNVEWNQPFTAWKTIPEDLVKWQSITDACINIDDTDRLLNGLYESVKKRRELFENNK